MDQKVLTVLVCLRNRFCKRLRICMTQCSNVCQRAKNQTSNRVPIGTFKNKGKRNVNKRNRRRLVGAVSRGKRTKSETIDAMKHWGHSCNNRLRNACAVQNIIMGSERFWPSMDDSRQRHRYYHFLEWLSKLYATWRSLILYDCEKMALRKRHCSHISHCSIGSSFIVTGQSVSWWGQREHKKWCHLML